MLSEGGQALTILGTIGFFSAVFWLIYRAWGKLPPGKRRDDRPPHDRMALLDNGSLLILASTLIGTDRRTGHGAQRDRVLPGPCMEPDRAHHRLLLVRLHRPLVREVGPLVAGQAHLGHSTAGGSSPLPSARSGSGTAAAPPDATTRRWTPTSPATRRSSVQDRGQGPRRDQRVPAAGGSVPRAAAPGDHARLRPAADRSSSPTAPPTGATARSRAAPTPTGSGSGSAMPCGHDQLAAWSARHGVHRAVGRPTFGYDDGGVKIIRANSSYRSARRRAHGSLPTAASSTSTCAPTRTGSASPTPSCRAIARGAVPDPAAAALTALAPQRADRLCPSRSDRHGQQPVASVVSARSGRRWDCSV